jgi:hypothetical protein
LSDLSF